MTMPPTTNAIPAAAEGEIARLCEEISDRLRRREPVDLEDYAARWPAHADDLRQLLPAMRMMAGIRADAPLPSAGSTVPDATPNESLGDFRIVREIGRGGMGIVYEAEQLSLRRNVALKVLPFAAVLDSRQLRRFHNEAQAAALLHHPRIVPVYGVGCERGVHYYAMQLIEGPTVAQVVRDLRSRVGLDPPLPEQILTTPPVTGESVDRAQAPVRVVSAPGDCDAAQIVDPPSPSKSTVPQGILSTARNHRSPAFVQASVQLGIDVAEAPGLRASRRRVASGHQTGQSAARCARQGLGRRLWFGAHRGRSGHDAHRRPHRDAALHESRAGVGQADDD
jgi:hypothetical protein